jgi:hypothetical protein
MCIFIVSHDKKFVVLPSVIVNFYRTRGQYDHLDVQDDHDRYDQYHDRGHDQYDRMEDYQYEHATSESRERERTRDVEHEYRRSERSLTAYTGLPNALFMTSGYHLIKSQECYLGQLPFERMLNYPYHC